MSSKKWIAVSAVIGTVATVAVFAFTNPVRVFRTVALINGVTQKQNTIHPEYEYTVSDGSNLVALALGTEPTSNQVFAMVIDCGSSGASLLAYDKSNSNQYPIATCDQLQLVKNQGPKSTFVNSERFVGQFAVQAIGNIAGGSLMVAGRLDLDTNGCPHAVLIAANKDSNDKTFADTDVVDTDPDAKVPDTLRAGDGHMVGWLNLVSGDVTNTVLVPLGRLTFRHQLEQFNSDVP